MEIILRWDFEANTPTIGKIIHQPSEKNFANSRIFMAELNSNRLLKGESPRLVDEWQIAPKLWNAM